MMHCHSHDNHHMIFPTTRKIITTTHHYQLHHHKHYLGKITTSQQNPDSSFKKLITFKFIISSLYRYKYNIT